MTFKNNKEVVEYFGKEFVTGGNLAVYEEIVVKDFVDHSSPNGNYQSMLNSFNGLRAAMPDMKVMLLKLIEEGDCVSGHKSLEGTHTSATLFGVAATGKSIKIDVLDIIRLENGKFVENWSYNNAAEVIAALQQQ